MIEPGINPVSELKSDAEGGYKVVLACISLPTLPLTRTQVIELNKRELLAEMGKPYVVEGPNYAKRFFDRLSEVNRARSMCKVSQIGTEFINGKQYIVGKVRSVGTRENNLLWYLRDKKPEQLCFGLRGFVSDHPDIVGAKKIDTIITFDLIAPPVPA